MPLACASGWFEGIVCMNVLELWGKTGADASYHPVLFHLLDVGHVAQLLLSDEALPRIREVLAHALGVADSNSLRHWLPLVIALHDIGKISPSFQGQVEEQKARLAALGFPFVDVGGSIRHQHLSAVWAESLPSSLSALRPLSTLIVDTYSGHHGQFPEERIMPFARQFVSHHEPAEWADLRLAAVDLVRREFSLPATIAAAPPNLRAATAALTGFLILCDWLGSDQGAFPPQPNLTLDEYVPLSRDRARKAVTETGFLCSHRRPSWPGFQAAFPDITTPRPLQRVIADDLLSATDWPGLFIIEAPTGEGKTEAALMLAWKLSSLGWSDELFFGLPTIATSNQMYGRVLRFVNRERTDSHPVKLIHGQAALVEQAHWIDVLGDRDDPESPAYAAPAWFSSKKRAVLAPFGVGTVDQVELGVLSARHYMLRLFGLAGKVVIIDEVHAYDTYMNTIIDHALSWLAMLGTPVILLSATLPSRRRRRLARAYRAGLRGESLDLSPAPANTPMPYPLISVYTRAGARTMSPPADPSRAQRLTIEFVPDLPADVEAGRLLDLNEHGGAIARITNTVGRAQAIFAHLRKIAPPNVECYLLHSQLPGDERLAREQQITERLGPQRVRPLDERIIVVGTQVLEQSLDYDVDLMISDFAPIDLLLQRAGRLQRHVERDRPLAFRTSTTLQLVLNVKEDGEPDFRPVASVYEPFILWKAWFTLRGRQNDDQRIVLSLPADYRSLIEATYDDRWEVVPEGHPFRPGIERSWTAYQRQLHQKQQRATERLIPDPDPDLRISEGVFLSFEEDEDGGKQGWGFAATRDGQETITLLPLHRVAAGVALHPAGEALRASTCDRDCQLRLLQRAIRVSNQTVVKELPKLTQAGLGWFRRAPLLRHAYPLVLDSGETEIGGQVVRLDPDLGLVIGKEHLA